MYSRSKVGKHEMQKIRAVLQQLEKKRQESIMVACAVRIQRAWKLGRDR